MPRLESILQTPAVRAFLLQCISFFPALFCVAAIETIFGYEVPLLVWALSQGLFAAALSRRIGLAQWWFAIQLLLPVALCGAQYIRIAPTVYLGGFLALLALYWTTFRTQVPFYPSTRDTWNAVIGLLPTDRPVRFIDIGSGFGGLVMHLAAHRPDCDVGGVELAPLPWFASVARAKALRSTARFLLRNYLELDFANYDIVFAFLSPAAMPALWAKARNEMRAGSVLISYEFSIPNAPPDVVLPYDNRGARLYAWHM